MPYFFTCSFQKYSSLVSLGFSASISSQYFTFVSAEISALLVTEPGFFLLVPDELACGDCWGSLLTSLAVFLAISMSSASLSTYWAFSISSQQFIPFPHGILLKSAEPLPFSEVPVLLRLASQHLSSDSLCQKTCQDQAAPSLSWVVKTEGCQSPSEV